MSLKIYSQDVDFKSLTLADHGVVTGHVREAINERIGDGIIRRYVMVKAGGTIGNNLYCKGSTTADEIVVVLTAAAAGEWPLGVNNTGGAVAAGAYFWLCQGPVYTVTTDAAIAAVGSKMMCDVSTAGNGQAYATGADNVCTGQIMNDLTGGAGTAKVYGYLGGAA